MLARILTLALALAASFAAPAFAQQSELDALANEIAKESKKSRVTKVAIFAFRGPGKESSQLGALLAQEVASRLELQGLETLSTARLEATAGEHKISLADLRDLRVARWVSEEAGAQAVVGGNFESNEEFLTVVVEIHKCSEPKKLTEIRKKLLLKVEWQPLLSQPREQLYSEPAPEADQSSPQVQVHEAGEDGTGYPTCRSCLNPTYTARARRERYNGRVTLRLIVTEGGKTSNIRIVRGAPFGLNESALQAVSKWRFNPAKQSGKAISVWTEVELNFLIYY